MSITYEYEIIAVNETARCMEVVYSAEGHQTMHISARLPMEGETLESVIDAFSPVPLWLETSKPVSIPKVGQRGRLAHQSENRVMTEEDIEARLNADMWAQVDFEKRVASALVRFGVLAVDPTDIPVAEL